MGALDESLITRHRLSVDQYHRMAETGVLEPDARVELIEGELIEMAAIGSRHFAAVSRLNRQLIEAAGSRAVVSVRSCLRLDRYNQPEPDLAILRPRADFYAAALPTGADSLLVIEVSDTTLTFDLRVKARLYAMHGVPEYWVVDLPASQLHVHRVADGQRYRDVTTLLSPANISVPGLDDVAIDLTELF